MSADQLSAVLGPGSEVPPPLRVARLDLDSLPRGRRSDLWVELAQDALGEPVSVPVSVLRGASDGPVLGITAALHGDELNGIACLHRLLEDIDPAGLSGSLVAILVTNMPGFMAGTRRFVDGNDLNHLMPGDETGKEAERYAQGLVSRILERFDVFIDLHTASVGRINSLYVRADLDLPASAAMALRQAPDILLHAPTSETSLRGTALARGMPAITVEVGDPAVWQPEMVQRTVRGLRANMLGLGMLEALEPLAGLDIDGGQDKLIEGALDEDSLPPRKALVICARSSWLRTDRGGLLEVLPALGERVEEGQEIGRLHDVFGQVLERFYAPEKGIVIGRAVSPLAPSGARILHLGVEAGPGDRFVGLDALREGKAHG